MNAPALPTPDTPPADGSIRSVLMAFNLLELLAGRAPMGVTEIAREMNSTKARVFRHLRTLIEAGYVAQDPATEKYAVTVRLFLMGQTVGEQFDFLAAMRKVMRPLRDALGHTVTCSKTEADGVLVLDMVRGTSPFEIGTKPGSKFPFHCSAQGKLALAFGDPALREAVLAGKFGRVDGARLSRELDAVKARGWAVAPDEILPGINALAAPVFNADGSLAGTLALVDSVQFVPADPPETQINELRAAAGAASRELGYVEAA